MPQTSLFNRESARAARQPKSDRLILERYLENAAASFHLTEEKISAAHAVLVKWAELESSGRLASFNETQMQGDFLAEVFGDALGYSRFTNNAETWQLVQHHSIDGGTPDAVLGKFAEAAADLRAIIELKGPKVHLDRDRMGGRTPVDQCWDYLVNKPTTCRWGIVSNIISFRLYERDSTKRRYEHFTLQGLKKVDEFRRFYALLNRQWLIDENKAEQLLRDTNNRQRQVGEELYDSYSQNRIELIRFLHLKRHAVDDAIEMAQRLFDRVIFIAFCEDRNLLPEETIAKARTVSGFYDVTNPKWQNFKRLFGFINY
ncbi:MAG TPA: hypothetical protein VGI75_01920, partial [Pirellulales bacterium]